MLICAQPNKKYDPGPILRKFVYEEISKISSYSLGRASEQDATMKTYVEISFYVIYTYGDDDRIFFASQIFSEKLLNMK